MALTKLRDLSTQQISPGKTRESCALFWEEGKCSSSRNPLRLKFLRTCLRMRKSDSRGREGLRNCAPGDRGVVSILSSKLFLGGRFQCVKQIETKADQLKEGKAQSPAVSGS